jgi:tol-pal system protein YbgF
MYRTPLLVAIVALLLSAPPALTQSREDRQMMADIRMLQQQTQQLQLTLNTLTEALQTVSQKLSQQLSQQSQQLDQQTEGSRKTFADLKLLSDNISGDVRVVREKIDDTNVRLGSLGQEVEAIQTAIQTLSRGASQSPTTATSPLAGGPETPPEPGTQSPEAPVSAAPPGVSPAQTLDRALGDYQTGQYSLAIQGFNTYLSYFPNSPDAARAQYYIGEAYRSDQKLEQALAAYDKVIATYPMSAWVAGARYHRADVLQQLGRVEAAKAEYELIVKNYPDKTEAGLAKQRLTGLLTPR